jgi:Icc-related predicted phosphoesterase
MAHVTRILCAAAPRGSHEALERLLDAAERHDVDAVAVVGDLTAGGSDREGYRAVFQPLGHGGLPTHWVPGPEDAPVADELERLRYPRWEPEYRLKLLHELDEHQLVLLFATPPAHKGLGLDGSEVLAELITTYRPRLVVSGGVRGSEWLGRTLVVAPGELADGHYAVADLHAREAELEAFATAG